MKGLSATQVLHAWELGLARMPAERVVAILAAAEPGVSFDDLAALPLGCRNARLRTLREATFGPRYQALASCPACNEPLELGFDAGDVAPAEAGPGAAPATLRLGDYTIEVRPLDTTDLVAAARCPDVETARQVLARRAIGVARRGDAAVTLDTVPDELVPALAAHVEAADPDTDTVLEVTCSACGIRWDAALDIAGYLWAEIEAEAIRLLRDVHCLARGYGWREADILAMSPFRRRAYLELVQA